MDRYVSPASLLCAKTSSSCGSEAVIASIEENKCSSARSRICLYISYLSCKMQRME